MHVGIGAGDVKNFANRVGDKARETSRGCVGSELGVMGVDGNEESSLGKWFVGISKNMEEGDNVQDGAREYNLRGGGRYCSRVMS